MYRSKVERKLERGRLLKAGALALVGFILAMALDVPAFYLFSERLPVSEEVRAAAEAAETAVPYSVRRDHVEGEDWYRLLRISGSMWTWLFVGAAFMLIDRARPRGKFDHYDAFAGWRRGAILLTSAFAAGIVAELLKVVLGRERPVDGIEYQGYVFKAIFGGLTGDGGNLGLPSSHTAVAFGAAGALALLHAPLRGIAVVLACGCGISRMLVGAHWLSDVYMGAVVGLWTASVVHPLLGGRPPNGSPILRDKIG